MMTVTKIEKHYDEEGDILYIEFKPADSVRGIQLTENIVLRADPASGDVVGLAIHNYTKIAVQQLADPLTSLSVFDNKTLLETLTSKPLSNFLTLQQDAISLGPALLPQVAKAA
jgi:uncharacterized protein YuzE